MSKLFKLMVCVAVAVLGRELYAYSGGYENSLDCLKYPGVGYANNTLTTREESGKEIKENYYAQCKKLKSVNLTGVTSIGNAAFAYSALESVTIPSTVTSIGYIAFGGCTNLTSATFGATGWYSVQKEPFKECTRLTTITVPGGVPSYGAGFVAQFPKLKTIRCQKAYVSAWKTQCPTLNVVDKDATYTIVYHKYDGSVVALTNVYAYGISSTLRTLPATWARKGLSLKGWANSPANAKAGIVWKTAGGGISAPVEPGKTLDVYAVWQLNAGWYMLRYNKNDGSGSWRTVAYQYGVETTLPSLAVGLGWSYKGHEFMGWSTSVEKAMSGQIWRGDRGTTKTPTTAGTTLDIFASWKKLTTYSIEFNKNDGSGAKYSETFTYGTATALPSYLNATKMGWAKRGFDFKGWAVSEENAAAGKVWKTDKAKVSMPTEVGTVLKVYAVYAIKPAYYGLRFIKNDGTGAFMLVGYEFGVKTRLPTCENGLKWSRAGYKFAGWALGKANALAGKIWKADWAYVATGVPAGTTADVYALWTKATTGTLKSVAKQLAQHVQNPSSDAMTMATVPSAFLVGVIPNDAGVYELVVGPDDACVHVMYVDGTDCCFEGDAIFCEGWILFVTEEGDELTLLR